MSGQEQRRLPGRVAAPEDHHGLAPARTSLEFGGGVVDASTLKLGPPIDRKTPVARSCRHEDGLCRHLAPVTQQYSEQPQVIAEASDHARAVDAGPELLSLDRCSVGQLVAGDPTW